MCQAGAHSTHPLLSTQLLAFALAQKVSALQGSGISIAAAMALCRVVGVYNKAGVIAFSNHKGFPGKGKFMWDVKG